MIVRAGEMKAHDGKADALRKQVETFVPMIRSAEGCIACQAYQSEDDPSRFVIVETWVSADAHQASVKQIPPQLLAETKALIAGFPWGGYFRNVI
ncbi:MAG: putative quinol monooxygenase [Gemmatimonadaceae bacterium]